MDLCAHEEEQTALALSTMKIKDDLPDGNIVVSPIVSVVGIFRQPGFASQRFHGTSFQNITKCDADILCPCTPCRALRCHDYFIMKFDVDSYINLYSMSCSLAVVSKTRRSVFVETEAESEAMPEAEDEVNAQFLMQATFGPTRNSLTGLAGITHEWVHQQMRLPVELHRAYYRPRVNPVLLERRSCAGSVRCNIEMVPVCLHACRCRETSESWPPAPSLL